ncbi:MAG: hydrogenase nickel incorporation protein HypB [Clostridium sp.]
MKELTIKTSLLKNNDEVAEKNREWLGKNKVMTVNLMGSPGAGKTSVLEKIIGLINNYKVAVIEGDLYTSKDGDRIKDKGVEVIQINTVGGCHLDAAMVHRALTELNKDELELIIIENVGNLVCPASFNLGEDKRIVVISVTEGNDKPLKYPHMFQKADFIILNKVDLIEFTDFQREDFYKDIKSINEKAVIVETSCRNDIGLQAVGQYLTEAIKEKQGLL